MPRSLFGTLEKKVLLGVILSIIGATLFASKSIVVKLSFDENITVEELMLARYAICVPIYIVMAIFALKSRETSVDEISSRTFIYTIFLGVIGYWLSSYLDFLGLQYVDASVERMILFTYPLLTIFFGWLLFGHKIKARAIMGAVCAYLGLVLMFYGIEEVQTNFVLGVVFVFASAVTFAIYQLLAKVVVMAYGPMLATAIMMLAACIAAMCAYVLSDGLDIPSFTNRSLALAFMLAIGGTVLPSIFFGYALALITSELNASLTSLGPVITIALAVSILNEKISSMSLLGSLIVLFGVSFVVLSELRKKSAL